MQVSDWKIAAVAILFVESSFWPVAVAGEASDAIGALSEERRAEAFRDVIDSSGFDCSQVTRVFLKGESEADDAAHYAVRCDPGTDFIVAVLNSGNMSTNVLSCAVFETIGGKCWDPY